MDDETAHTCIKYKVIYSPCPVPLYQTNTTHIPQTPFLNSHLFLSWTVHLGCKIFKVKLSNMDLTRPIFRLFSSFSHSKKKYSFNFNNISWKSIDGALVIRTRARRMLGADKTTELWRLIQHFIGESTLFKFCVLIWAKPGLFCFHFRPFLITMTNMSRQT